MKHTRSVLLFLVLLLLPTIVLSADTTSDVEISIKEPANLEIAANDIVVKQKRMEIAIEQQNVSRLLIKEADVHVQTRDTKERMEHFKFRFTRMEKE